MNLTPFEETKLLEIAVTQPYSFTEVRKVYNNVKSFDLTLKLLKASRRLNSSWDEIVGLPSS